MLITSMTISQTVVGLAGGGALQVLSHNLGLGLVRAYDALWIAAATLSCAAVPFLYFVP
jgi:hypothetical protein